MYKVLLADDEDLDLQGLKLFMPWNSLGLEVAAAVSNGFAALEYMDKEKIDILVSDIRMPHMSGLELARKALEKQEELRIIFISGYEDFNYAKQALQLNASNYVLKPVNEHELAEALKSVKDELDLVKQRSLTEAAWKQMTPIIKHQLMIDILEGSSDLKKHDRWTEEFKIDFSSGTIRVAIIEIDDFSWKLNPYHDEERAAIITSLSELIDHRCRSVLIHHVYKINSQRIALILDLDPASDGTLFYSWIEEVRTKYPVTITIGIGEQVTTVEQLKKSYRQAKDALDYKMFGGKSKVIEYQHIHNHQMQDMKDFELKLDGLFTSMYNYDLVHLHDEIEDLFRIVKKFKSKISVHHFIMSFIVKLDAYLNTMNENLYKMLDMEFKNLDVLFHFETIDDIQAWLKRRIFEISELLHNKKQKRNQKLINEILQYIDNHLQDNITLRDVGDYFSFSPNYLGSMFKDETGKNFTEYVIQLKLEKARQLLKNPKVKIFEAAQLVGYRNLAYFSRQFKEMFGITPGDFKKQS